MLLQMMVLLALASTAVEGFFAWHVPAWRRITKKYRLLDLFFSFFLSFAMGKFMGAPSGLVIFGAGVISTVISMPMYPALNWCEANAGKIAQWRMKGQEMAQDLVRLMVFLIRVVTFPFWFSRRVHAAVTTFRSSLKEAIN